MRRLALLAVVLAAPAARAQAPAGGGFVASEESRVEVLAAPVRVGERVERPEGWYRVEEAGPEDREAGSFGVVPATALAEREEEAGPGAAPEPAARAEARLGVGPEDRLTAPADVRGEGPAYALADPCRAERTAYLRELLRLEGIEVADPVGLMEGLEGATFARGFNWFWLSLRIDPIRPLSSSSNLRALADRLARCASDR